MTDQPAAERGETEYLGSFAEYADWTPGPLDCCGHCAHDVNDPPHDRPCPEGCNTSD
jgi:hypothetical protein